MPHCANTDFRPCPLAFMVICVGAMFWGSPPAQAQSTDSTANRHTIPEDQRHIRLGRFVLTPEITSRAQYDDNIFLTESNRQSDVITTLAPRLALSGDWPFFQMHLAMGGELGFFARSDDDNYQDADLKAAGSLDLGTSSLDGAIDWQRRHDPRGSNDVSTAAREPVIYRDVRAHIGGRYVTRGWRYESRLSLRRVEFDDSTAINGTLIRNDDRNRLETRETIRALLPLDLGREAYGEMTLNQRQYDRTPDDSGLNRDSAGFQMLGGMRFDLTDLIRADLAAGWMSQSYVDPSFGNINDYTLRADIDWSVTRLSHLTLNAARTVRETTVTGASGILAFDFGIGISHELRRNLQIGLNAAYSDEDFQQVTRQDRIATFGLNADYHLNRFARISGAIDHDIRQSNSSGEDYRRLQSLISLKLEM